MDLAKVINHTLLDAFTKTLERYMSEYLLVTVMCDK